MLKLAVIPLASLLLVEAPPNDSDDKLVRVGFCLPKTVRFSQCINGTAYACVRTRHMNCRTKTSCTPSSQTCPRKPGLLQR